MGSSWEDTLALELLLVRGSLQQKSKLTQLDSW